MNDPIEIRYENARTAPAVALGFFAIGLGCLLASLAVLLIHPQVTVGDPYRMEALALGALAVFGFVASFLFGAAYLVSPVMAANSLFSGRLAAGHLVVHAFGLGWLIVVFGGMRFLENPDFALFTGVGILLLGALAHILDLLLTASRLNRWEPEQLTLMAALFWLGVTSVLGLAVLLAPWLPTIWHDPVDLLEAHAPLGLVGFLWLSLLGFALKLFNMFLVSEKSAGGLAWAGWVLVNAALMALVPILLLAGGAGLSVALGLLCLGSLLYLADIVRLWLAARRPLDWALTGAFLGLLTGFGLFLWILAGLHYPYEEDAGGAAVRETTRIFFVVGIFGTFALTMLGLAVRLVPFLVWQLRCAPLAAKRNVPDPRALALPGGGTGMMLCLAAAWAYLAAAQWLEDAAGIQLAAVCLLTGLFWFLWAIKPALKIFVFGIRLPGTEKPAEL